MKIAGTILLSLYLILGDALAIEPVGTIGKGYVRQLTFLPDGNMLRVMPKHIEIVAPDNDVVLANFAGSTEYMGLVVVSPEGGQLVIRGRDMIEIWDIKEQKKLGKWEFASLGSWVAGVLDYPSRVAFSRTQSLLAITGRTDEIFLLDWQTSEWIGRLEDNRRPIRTCYSRSGSNQRGGSWSSSRCNDRPPSIFSIAFSPDDRFIAVGSKRPDAEIWDLETRKLIGHLEGHEDWVTKVVYSPDGQWIATTEVESTKVYLWNAGTRQLVRTLRNGNIEAYNPGEVFELFFSGDSRRLYVGTRTRYPAFRNTFNDRLRVWDVETSALINEIRAEPTSLKHVSVSPDESRAILQYYDQVAVLWDLKQNRQLRLWADYGGGGWSRLSPDGRSLVEVNSNLIKIWDVPTSSLRHVVFQGMQHYRRPYTLAISPDSRRFAVGLETDGTEVRDLHTGKLETYLPYTKREFAFSNRGNRIVVSGFFGINSMIVVDVDQPHQRELLEVDSGGFIAFSADDRYLAAMGPPYRMNLWEQGKEGYNYRYAWPLSLYSGSSFGSNLVFHPHADPPILVFAWGTTVVGWQLGKQSPEQIFRIDGRGPAHFSEDGRYLFLNGEDGLQIWNWRANQPLEHPFVPEYSDVSRDGSVLLTRVSYPPQIWDVTPFLRPKPVVLGRIREPVLLVNFPNPFNPETWIPYQLSELANVNIRIHDASGRQVRVLELGSKPAGNYLSRSRAAFWDGRNDAGEAVSSGLYFYTLQAGESRSTRRMNLVK